jgi:transcription initiation factor TFIID subunit 7
MSSGIRDRTLVLRILVPGLETRLRDKMKELEEAESGVTAGGGGSAAGGVGSSSSGGGGSGAGAGTNNTTSSSTGGGGGGKESILDLEGVTCEPTEARNRTLWSFHCDGATYPAKLVNLPCPVEIHKTHDHAAYYKCQDVAQMLIVYEDDMALEEAEEKPVEGYPSYYPSGLTPPMRRVVERRFGAREHKAVAPPRAAVADVEEQLLQLMAKLQKEEKSKRNKLPSLTSATKVLEEVEEDIVDYEPWMDDNGHQPSGIDFSADDPIASAHPEIWLPPSVIQQVKDDDLAAKRKKQALAEKKEAKKEARRKEKADHAAAAAAAKLALPSKKKGIASQKNKIAVEQLDDVTQAAAMAIGDTPEEDLLNELGTGNLFEGLDLEGMDDMDF